MDRRAVSVLATPRPLAGLPLRPWPGFIRVLYDGGGGQRQNSMAFNLREIFKTLAEVTTGDLDGVPIPVASIRHLIAMKALAGRRNDLDDIEALRQIAADTGQETD